MECSPFGRGGGACRAGAGRGRRLPYQCFLSLSLHWESISGAGWENDGGVGGVEAGRCGHQIQAP